jgi:hypothetical protein
MSSVGMGRQGRSSHYRRIDARRLTSFIFRGMALRLHHEAMKQTLLLFTALAAQLNLGAQDATPPPAPKPDAGCIAAPAPPKAPPIRFKLPPKIQAMLDKQRADIERKTGITLPPPPPPGTLPPPKAKPCPAVPPVAPVQPPAAQPPATPSTPPVAAPAKATSNQ